MKNILVTVAVLGVVYLVVKASTSKKQSEKSPDADKKLNYSGGGGHHGHGGGNWRNPYILAMPYYGYPYSYYPQNQPEVCYTKTKTGKLLAHYCNDFL